MSKYEIMDSNSIRRIRKDRERVSDRPAVTKVAGFSAYVNPVAYSVVYRVLKKLEYALRSISVDRQSSRYSREKRKSETNGSPDPAEC